MDDPLTALQNVQVQDQVNILEGYYNNRRVEYEKWTVIRGLEKVAPPRSIVIKKLSNLAETQRILGLIIPHLGLFQFENNEEKTLRRGYADKIKASYVENKPCEYQCAKLNKETYLEEQIGFLLQFSPLIFQTRKLHKAILKQMDVISKICVTPSLPKENIKLRKRLLYYLGFLLHPSYDFRYFGSGYANEGTAEYRASKAERKIKSEYDTFYAELKDDKSITAFHNFLKKWFPDGMDQKDILARGFWIDYLSKALEHFQKQKKSEMVAHIQCVLSFVYFSVYTDSTSRPLSCFTYHRNPESDFPTKAVCLQEGLKHWLAVPIDSKYIDPQFMNQGAIIAWNEGTKISVNTQSYFSCFQREEAQNAAYEIFKSCLRAKSLEVQYFCLNQEIKINQEAQQKQDAQQKFPLDTHFNFILNLTPLAIGNAADLAYGNNNQQNFYACLIKESLVRLSWTLKQREGETRHWCSLVPGHRKGAFDLRKSIYDQLISSPWDDQNLAILIKNNKKDLTNGWFSQRFYDALLDVQKTVAKYCESCRQLTQSSTTSSNEMKITI